jgi:hypothetical protein
MPARSNCASACANQRAGRSGQKGGSRTATRYSVAPSESSAGSVILSVLCYVGRQITSGSPIMWVTVCCYCEITTVNKLTSVFILVATYSMIAINSLSVSDVFTSVSPSILWRRRAALMRSGRRYSREETDSTELAQ